MHLIQIIILAIVQGVAELLPVSSSAHVIVAEKLMGLDPTAPEMTLLLVMLHTGTMFAVILYFWSAWRASYFASAAPRNFSVRAVDMQPYLSESCLTCAGLAGDDDRRLGNLRLGNAAPSGPVFLSCRAD